MQEPHVIMLSSEAYERLIARAQAVGEELWRRQLFNNPGMLAEASPEAVKIIRELFVDATAERYVEDFARRANNYLDKEKKPAR